MRATQNTAAQPLPRITYVPRHDTGPQPEQAALANVYRFIIASHARKEATRPDAGKEIDERSGKSIIPK
jgi:hypothetical protein